MRGLLKLDRVARRCGLMGVGVEPLIEGGLHELAHAATIDVLLGGSVERDAVALLLGLERGGARDPKLFLGEPGLDPFALFMMSYYIDVAGIRWPRWLMGASPVWEHDEAAAAAYWKVSDACEVHAQAATYLLLYRSGIQSCAREKFDESKEGSNGHVWRYVDRCCDALRRPVTGRIADRVEAMVPRFLAAADRAGI